MKANSLFSVKLVLNTRDLSGYADTVLARLMYHIYNFRHYETEVIVLFTKYCIILIPTNSEFEVLYIHDLPGLKKLSDSDITKIDKLIALSNVSVMFRNAVNNKTLAAYRNSIKLLEYEIDEVAKRGDSIVQQTDSDNV
jgi:hypothetical protein